MWTILLFTIWLSCRAPRRVVQAVRTMPTKPLHPGLKLNFATWNCGGLSFTQKELCRELNYDILLLRHITMAKLKGIRTLLLASLPRKMIRIWGLDCYYLIAYLTALASKGILVLVLFMHELMPAQVICLLLGVYMPHAYRTESPFFNETLDNVLEKVSEHIETTSKIKMVEILNQSYLAFKSIQANKCFS